MTPKIFKLKDEINSKSGKTFASLKAVNYKSQVVAGTNYFIKVDTGSPNEHVHLRVHRPLPGAGDLQLHSLQLDKPLEEEINFF